MAYAGPLLSALGNTHNVQQFYSSLLQDRLERAGATVEANQALNEVDLRKYNAANEAALNTVAGFTGEDLANYKGLIQKSGAIDPWANYRNVGDYRTGVIDRAAAEIGKQGKAAQNLGFARLGYGGRGGSTYTDNAVTDRLTRNIAPAYLAALESVGRDSSALTAQQIQDIGNTQRVIAARRALPFDTVPQWLNPINARNATIDDTIGLLGGVNEAIKQNTAGFIAKDNLTRRLGNAWSEAENTSTNAALSAWASYMGQSTDYTAGEKDSAKQANTFTATQQDPSSNYLNTMAYGQTGAPANFGTTGNYYNGGAGYTQPQVYGYSQPTGGYAGTTGYGYQPSANFGPSNYYSGSLMGGGVGSTGVGVGYRPGGFGG